MAKPQQPELARSGRGAVDPHAVKEQLTAPTTGGGETDPGGPIPEDNLPGHHPEHDQDKPSGDAFVAKVREHAAEVEAAGAEGAGTIAGDALRAAAGVVRKVRERLPGD